MIPIATYFSSYADHMWRFYIRYRSGNIATANTTDVDRDNWTACNTIYSHLRPEWQTVVTLYYQRRDLNSPTVEEYCNTHAMTMSTVWTIIRSVQTLAAEERGLIAKRPFRMRKPEHYSSRREDFNRPQCNFQPVQPGEPAAVTPGFYNISCNSDAVVAAAPLGNSMTGCNNQTDPAAVQPDPPDIYTHGCNKSAGEPASAQEIYTPNRNFQTPPAQSEEQEQTE